MSKRLFTTAAIAIAAIGMSAPAQATELVTNGGFETGDFTGWTQFGNTGFSGVATDNPNSGTYEAYFGPIGSPGGIEQSLNTVAGGNYTISFWLQSDGGSPNSFSAFFDNNPLLMTLDGSGAFQYFQFTFNRIANSPPSLLQFSFQQDPAFWRIDDISVQGPSSVPEPSTWAMMLLGFGAAGIVIRRSRKAKPIAAVA